MLIKTRRHRSQHGWPGGGDTFLLGDLHFVIDGTKPTHLQITPSGLNVVVVVVVSRVGGCSGSLRQGLIV